MSLLVCAFCTLSGFATQSLQPASPSAPAQPAGGDQPSKPPVAAQTAQPNTPSAQPAPSTSSAPAAASTSSTPAAASANSAPPTGQADANASERSSGFDPKVRRIGVQMLDDPATEHRQELSEEVAARQKRKAKADPAPATAKDSDDARARPTFKVGAQYFVLPIAESGRAFGEKQTFSRVHQRARLSGQARYRSLGLKTQIQDVRTFGQGFGAGATSSFVNLALHQGYLELVGESKERGYHSFFRVGRQAIIWGEQRLLGAGEWTIHGRSFDAARMLVGYRDHEVDAFWSVLTPRAQGGNSREERGSHLGGLRLASQRLQALSGELFGLIYINDGDSKTNTEQIGNLGVRLFGDPVPALHYSLEGNFQFGERLGLPHRAYAVAGWASWRHALSDQWDLVPMLGVSAASGQRDTTKSREFFNFFPANHRNYGLLDRFGWRNMIDYEARLQAQMQQRFDLALAYHFFSLESARGTWKNAPGNAVDPALVGNTAKHLGSEIDLWFNYRPLKGFSLQGGYGVFIPTEKAYERLGVAPGQRQVLQRVFLLMRAAL